MNEHLLRAVKEFQFSTEAGLTYSNRVSLLLDRLVKQQKEEFPVLIAMARDPYISAMAKKHGGEWLGLLIEFGEAMQNWGECLTKMSENSIAMLAAIREEACDTQRD